MGEPTIWSKSNTAWGSARRVQRNAYAYAVAMVMTNGRLECPACSRPLDIDTAEVDRPIPSYDYTPGNVVYICRACNQGRSVLQSDGHDWRYAAMYAEDVRIASMRVSVPTVARAKAWWADRHGDGEVSVRVCRYA